MYRVHVVSRHRKPGRAGQEHGSEDSEGTSRSEIALLNGLMNKVVVGMVGGKYRAVGPFSGTFQEVGVPKHVRTVSHKGTQPQEVQVIEREPRSIFNQRP